MAATTSPFIGYPGSPKDYSSLEAMRKRQKEVDDKAAKARTQKELDEIMKATDVDPGKYLPFRIPEVKGIMAEGVDKILKAAAAGDYSALQEAKNDIKLRSGNFVAERDDFDKVIKASEGGQVFTPADYRRLYSGKGKEDFQDLIESGALQVHQETGRFVPTAFDNVDLPKYMIEVVGKYKNAPTNKMDALGRQIYETDVEGATNALAYTYDNEPAIKAKYKLMAGNSVVKEGRSKEQYEAELRNKFIQDGLGMIQPSKVVRPSKGNNFNFSFGDGTQDARMSQGTDQQFQSTYIDPVDGTAKLGNFTIANFNGVGNKKANMPMSSTAWNVETGQPAKTSANEDFVFNGFGDIYVLTQDFKTTARNGKVVEFRKGAVIPDELVPFAKEKGATKQILGATVKGESGSFVVPADIFMQSATFDETTGDKEAITEVFKRAAEKYKKGVSVTTSSKPNKGGGSSQPKKQFKNVPKGGFN